MTTTGSSSSNSNNPYYFSFDYDYNTEQWNISRNDIPKQLKLQGVPYALWVHFYDYSQSVVERVRVRSIMKKKLMRMEDEDHNNNNNNNAENNQQTTQTTKDEISRLDEQTLRDYECLQRQAERLFPNTRARINKNNHIATTQDHFSLEIQLLHHYNHNSSSSSHDKNKNKKNNGLSLSNNKKDNQTNQDNNNNIVHLHYNSKRSSWNLPRGIVPVKLQQYGVTLTDWITIWDYGYGVNQRAKEREHLNELHERELKLCYKSLTYMNTTNIASVDFNTASNHNTTANHIRTKIDKLQRAKEANFNNTKKGWQELQRRSMERFEPYGIKSYLSRPENEKICCGLQFQCPTTSTNTNLKTSNNGVQQGATTTSTSTITSPTNTGNGGKQRSILPITSSIWFPTTSSLSLSTTPSRSSRLENSTTSPAPPPTTTTTSSVWNFAKDHFKTTSNAATTTTTSSASSVSSTESLSGNNNNNNNVLRPKHTVETENNAPKPESLLLRKTTSSLWDQPVVLTFVHDEIPSRIEVTTPLSSTTTTTTTTSNTLGYNYNHGNDDVHDPFDDEDSHGYVVPPAPSDPPSSIGSTGSSISGIITSPSAIATRAANKKKLRRVHFGPIDMHEYENPYTKDDRKVLWYTHEDREACRSKTKVLAQRVIDNRNNGGSNNVVFMDNDTEEEVCWRGLEHAKKGNLSFRQETRRAHLVKVLEKQRLLRLNSISNRRGAPSVDPAKDLRDYAYRQSRQCRERAQKLAAQDAKEARAVYKESLRKANLQHHNHNSHQQQDGSNNTMNKNVHTSSSKSNISISSSTCSSDSHHSYFDENGLYHKNDIFQDYCRQMHLASKARLQQAVV